MPDAQDIHPVLHSLGCKFLALAVSKFSSWFVGWLCLCVDAAVCIADLSVGCMHVPPQGIMGESSFSRGESRASATESGVLLNFGVL